ncbi:hypothetical protein HHI36_013791 [Cryptolaemus montrouzieri]|uniref:Carboxylesterase type B domain-containing protein n=1 Tax=Cryptolaemus montrouzieri TaxID=559131 RepID=A0ABD2NJA6_9CUCU
MFEITDEHRDFVSEILTLNPREGLLFAPVIEPNHNGAFLSKGSYEIIKSGNYQKMPAMLGYTSLEGTMSISNIFRLLLLKYDLTPSYFVPIDMNIKNSVIKDSVGREIKFQYFGLVPVSLSFYKILTFISEDQFVRPIQQFATMLAKNAPTFLYEFCYEGGLGGKVDRATPGVAHGEEVGYLFRNNITANVTDALTRSRMIKLWTNFAKFQNPTPYQDPLLQNQIWQPIDPNSTDVNYFNIDYDLTSSINPRNSSMEFWTKIYRRYGEPPYDTY